MSEDSANYVPTLKRSTRDAARPLISAPIAIFGRRWEIFHVTKPVTLSDLEKLLHA
jgi:hypothetical protein